MQTLERTVGRSSCIAVFLLAGGYLATLCPFYAVRHHAWIFACLLGLFFLKEDFSSRATLDVSIEKNPGFLVLGLGLAGVLVPVLFTLFTWFNEFPWRGDYDFHLPQSRVLSRSDWVIVVFALWAVLGVTFFLFQRKQRRTAWLFLLVVAISVVACEFWRPIPPHYARYPATVYVLQTPLFWLASAIGATESINLNRLFESLALIAWLFLLRPLVLRKRLTWPLVAVVWLLVTQGDTLYYLGGAYLEPWSLVCCLIALEACIVDGDFRLAFAFIGLAAIIKEQAILLLPFLVLAALAKEGFRWHRIFNVGLWAFFSMLPFLSYFLYRRDASVWRTAELAKLSNLANPDRIHEFLHRITVQFSMTGALALLLLIAAILAITWGKRRRFVTPELFIIGGALFLPLFFYCDRISAGWTGYPRFHLVSFFLVIFLAVCLMVRFRSLTLVLALTIFGIAQLPRFVHVWRFHNETAANFFEHYDAPIFLPIRRLTAKSEKSQGMTSGSAVQIIEPTEFQDLRQFDLGYPELSAKYKVLILSKPAHEVKFEDPGIRPLWVLVPWIRMANLNAKPRSSNLYSQFQLQERLVRDLQSQITSLGGSWSLVRDDKHELLGFIGRLR
jgi:hypothetical protein